MNFVQRTLVVYLITSFNQQLSNVRNRPFLISLTSLFQGEADLTDDIQLYKC